MLSSAPRLNHRRAPEDCADTDPATWRFRAGVPMNGPPPKPSSTSAFLDGPTSGADTDGWFDGWFKKKEPRVQIEPRVEGYAFDPLFMTDPTIYQFERGGQPLPRRFYKQTRKNKAAPGEVRYDHLGSVARTANGDDSISIYVIEWEKHAGGVLDFEMFDKNMNVIVVGYCKQTDYGGAFKWVVVVTKLHGMDIPADQGPRLFSYPLYGALASGVSFGIWYENRELQTKFPNMGAGVPRDDERELRDAMDRNARLSARRKAGISTAHEFTQHKTLSLAGAMDELHVSTTGEPAAAAAEVKPSAPDEDPRGAALASLVRVSDRNTTAKLESQGVRFDPPGKAKGAGMLVRPEGDSVALGAIYPMRTKMDIRHDGLCITRIKMIETPVRFKEDQKLTGVSRYEVELFTDGVEKPVATLAVLPEAYPSRADSSRLVLSHHTTKLKVGSRWVLPGIEEHTVTKEDAENVATKVPVWDCKMSQSIEATMWKLRFQNRDATAEIVLEA